MSLEQKTKKLHVPNGWQGILIESRHDFTYVDRTSAISIACSVRGVHGALKCAVSDRRCIRYVLANAATFATGIARSPCLSTLAAAGVDARGECYAR